MMMCFLKLFLFLVRARRTNDADNVPLSGDDAAGGVLLIGGVLQIDFLDGNNLYKASGFTQKSYF